MLSITARTLIIGLTAALAASCGSTSQAVLNLRHAQLTSQIERCQSTIQLLRKLPNPDTSADASVFVPLRTLNDILAGAAGTYPIPSADAELDIRRLQVDANCAVPVVRLDAVARRGAVSVTMQADAMLDIAIDPQRPTEAQVRVALTDITPVARWKFFEFKLRGFVRDLLHVALAEYAAAMPAFTLPLQIAAPFDLPAHTHSTTFAVPSGTITGRLQTPGLKGTLQLRLDRILFLEDGLHAYFAVTF